MIDIKKIDDRIKKLEMIKLLALDPEMVEILEGVVTPNGSKPEVTAREPQRNTMKPKRGEQRKAVLKAVSEMTGRFTAADIVTAMTESGFKFAAQTPTIAVNGALKNLVENGNLTIAVKGSGRAFHQYERTSQVSAP